ncbi:MAG: hypothetical protein WBN28_13325 [Lutimonas sp.]
MKRKIALKYLLILMAIIPGFSTYAQYIKYQPDKPGKFIYDNRLDKCPGVDVPTIQNKLTTIVEWVRQNNPVIEHPTGFDALVHLTGDYWNANPKNEDFGNRSSIAFLFSGLHLEKDGSTGTSGNAAHYTEIFINSPFYYIGTRFDEVGFQTDDPPHLKQPLEKALANLKRYFTTHPIIKEIAPGVRLYDPGSGNRFTGVLLVFNPDRPEFWIPVTVKEIMEAKLEYYKVKKEIDRVNQEKMLAAWAKMNFTPDPGQVPTTTVYDEIKKEYENFTDEELNRPAFLGSGEQYGVSGINARGDGVAVVRFNPECWDRSLPVSSVQFMTLRYRSATAQELEEFIPRNLGLTDFEGIFYNNLPIEKMGVLIDRK